MKLSKTGKVIPNGVKPTPHEWDTFLFFTDLGKNVELIMPSNTPYNKNADCIIDSVIWEAKSPTTTNHRSIERLFYNASNQSDSIIIDLRRAKGKEDAVATLEKCFKNTRKVRNMHIITRNGTLRTYKK